MRWVGATEIKEKLRISGSTLQRWREQDRIRWVQKSERKIRYGLEETARDRLGIACLACMLVSHDGRRGERQMIENAYMATCPDRNGMPDIFDDIEGWKTVGRKIKDHTVRAVVIGDDPSGYSNGKEITWMLETAMEKGIDVWILNKERVELEEWKGPGHEFGMPVKVNEFAGKKLVEIGGAEVRMSAEVKWFDAVQVMGLSEEQTEAYKRLCEDWYIVVMPK